VLVLFFREKQEQHKNNNKHGGKYEYLPPCLLLFLYWARQATTAM